MDTIAPAGAVENTCTAVELNSTAPAAGKRVAEGQLKKSALATAGENTFASSRLKDSYFGGKGQDGVYQTLINQIPPHRLYAELFLGGGSIMRRKKPAALNLGYELDIAAIEAFKKKYPHAALSNSCGMAAISQLKHQDDAFLFIDPPYPLDTRRSDVRYNFELTDNEHRLMLMNLIDSTADVMIATYPNDLYEKHLGHWRKLEYTSVDRGGNVRDEVVYMNYAEPEYLHDYTYLGENKDHRQRIRRKIKTNSEKVLGWESQLRAKFLLEIAPHLTPEERKLIECS